MKIELIILNVKSDVIKSNVEIFVDNNSNLNNENNVDIILLKSIVFKCLNIRMCMVVI